MCYIAFPVGIEIVIPQDDPVRMVSAQLEELNYRKLYCTYSSQGRKSAADPMIIFEVLVYGYMNGIYSTRKLEQACRKKVKEAVRQEFVLCEISGNVTLKKLQSLVESKKTSCEKAGIKFVHGIGHRKPQVKIIK